MADEGSIAQILMTFGGLFLIGLMADVLGRRTPLPRVTVLLVAGFLIGPSVLDWLPAFSQDWFPVLTNIALAMIGFLLGQNLTRARFGKLGRVVLTTSLTIVLLAPVIMFAVLAAAGVPVVLALMLAAVATATDPAASMDVAREYEAKGAFTDTLLGIVAIDDAWGLLLFAVLVAVAQIVTGHDGVLAITLLGAWEVVGALVLGAVLGLPMAYLTGRIRPGEPTQAEALGVVLLCAGIAEWLHVSYVLSAIVLGAVVANVARHHQRPFGAIEGLEWPFLILFFLLAGAALQVDALATAGLLTAGYVALRVVGRLVAARLGARWSGAGTDVQRWMGLALLPQAGLAIGMALLASQRFPEIADVILPVVLASTVVFEVVGPVATRWALIHVGDISPNGASAPAKGTDADDE